MLRLLFATGLVERSVARVTVNGAGALPYDPKSLRRDSRSSHGHPALIGAYHSHRRSAEPLSRTQRSQRRRRLLICDCVVEEKEERKNSSV